MSETTILVLAASRYQVPIILQARDMGYRVITTDNVPDNPGHKLADKCYGIDTTDRKGILSIARKEGINGVIAACTDVALPAAAYVAQNLGLPGVPYESANICCDKIAFRKFLHDNNLPVPEAHPFTITMHPSKDIFSNKCVIKPDRSSGSKGIFIIGGYEEFLSRKDDTLAFSPNGKGVCETFIEGDQGTCEGIIHDGEVIWNIVTDRQTAPSPFVATYGHSVPSSITMERQNELICLIEEICRRLNIKNSVFDCDFVSSASGIIVLEFTPRLGGNSLTRLISNAVGFNMIEYAIKQACGLSDLPIPLNRDVQPTALVLLGVMQEGALQYDKSELSLLRQESWVKELELDYLPGAHVQPFINGRHRVGEAIVCAPSHRELDQRVCELKKSLNLHIS